MGVLTSIVFAYMNVVKVYFRSQKMIHGKDNTTFIVRDRPIRWQLQIGTGSTNKIESF